MSNILIIKHGSLGDLIQANGAIKDIKKFYPNRKVFLLTTQPYSLFMSECPYLDGVLIDKRLPRWNLFYLKNLKKIFWALLELELLQTSLIILFKTYLQSKKKDIWIKNIY